MRSCFTCIRGPERSSTKVACRNCDDDLHLYAATKYEATTVLDTLAGFNEDRIDVVGQNGNTGDHYAPDRPSCFGQYMRGPTASERECDTCPMIEACRAETPPLIPMGRGTYDGILFITSPPPTPQETSAPHNSASGFLRRADQIMEERGKTYDAPAGERSMARTVQAFNAITSNDLTEAEGWLLMQLLKDVRQWQRPGFHQDSADDCVAYAALKAEALANA